MKTFNHVDAKTVADAVALLDANKGKANIIAGGTDLLCGLKTRIKPTYPEVIVNIKSIPNLSYIKQESGVLKIGALTTISAVANDATVKAKFPILGEAALSVASPLLRDMGTLGGNLCQDTRCWYYRASKNYFFCARKGGTLCFAISGDNRYNAIVGGQVCFAVCPSDMAIALTALDAKVITNKRSLPIGDFFKVLGTALDANEIVTEVQVPEPKAGTKQYYRKMRLRKTLEWALESVATAITQDGGKVTEARVILGGVAPVPYRTTAAEDVLKGNAISDAIATQAGAAAVKNAIPLARNAYKVPIAKAMVARAILASK